MTIDTKTVKKVAHLARIAVSETEVTALHQDLSNILALVGEMQAINTDHVSPLAHPVDAHQPLRADTISEINQQDLFLKLAPHAEMGLYLVPQVIETE